MLILLSVGITVFPTQKPQDSAPLGWEVGDRAPDFSLHALDGEEVKLSDYAGRVVALNFWSWGCAACGEPVMLNLQQTVFKRYSRDDVSVLSVNAYPDPDVDMVRNYIDEEQVTYPVLINGLQVSYDYRVVKMPILFLIDKDGIIRYRQITDHFDQTAQATLEELVAEPAAQAQTSDSETPTIDTGWRVGERATDFKLFDTQANPHTLSSYFGMPILLSFWGKGCVECGDLVPGVYAQQIQKRYGGPEHLAVLGVDQHTFFDTLTGFIEAMEIQYPVLIDDYGMVSATYLVGFELEEFFFVVIDQAGVIRFRGNELKQEIFVVLDELMGV